MTTTNRSQAADDNHLFRTFLGVPPSKDDVPFCGADLPDGWDFAGPRALCPTCETLAGCEMTPKRPTDGSPGAPTR